MTIQCRTQGMAKGMHCYAQNPIWKHPSIKLFKFFILNILGGSMLPNEFGTCLLQLLLFNLNKTLFKTLYRILNFQQLLITISPWENYPRALCSSYSIHLTWMTWIERWVCFCLNSCRILSPIILIAYHGQSHKVSAIVKWSVMAHACVYQRTSW